MATRGRGHCAQARLDLSPCRGWAIRWAWPCDARAPPVQPAAAVAPGLACSRDGNVNCFVAGTLLRHVWRGGARCPGCRAPHRPGRRAGALAPADDADGAWRARRCCLRTNTEAATARGVFGVPTFEVDVRFWGFDSLPMLRAYGRGRHLVRARWDAAASVAQGACRLNGSFPRCYGRSHRPRCPMPSTSTPALRLPDPGRAASGAISVDVAYFPKAPWCWGGWCPHHLFVIIKGYVTQTEATRLLTYGPGRLF